MNRKIALIGVGVALAAAIAISQANDGESAFAWFSGAPEKQTLTNPNNGEAVTLEAVQNEAEWRKDTAEKLRELD
ncbi:hypothetical protein [Pelagibius sp.]|uniref:hypothetical protein n=1 Tax=Pelagibius sp. TaxID=1931238 RepID=UPI003BAF175C